jgi:hypothetical protein
MPKQQHYSMAEAARDLAVPPWRLRRECEILELAGTMQFERLAHLRIIRAEQLPQLRAWLERRGLLSTVTEQS